MVVKVALSNTTGAPPPLPGSSAPPPPPKEDSNVSPSSSSESDCPSDNTTELIPFTTSLTESSNDSAFGFELGDVDGFKKMETNQNQ